MISNCGSDENGKAHGGKAGDQTGREWRIKSWYDRPWKCILRYKGNSEVNGLLADLAIQSAENDKIGYDQWERQTFWKNLVKANYHPEDIKAVCESDCSAGVMALVKAVGFRLNIKALKDVNENLTCRGMRKGLQKAGFEVLDAKKYLTSEKYLERGDILLNDTAHTAIEVGDGKVKAIKDTEKPQEKPQSKPESSQKLINKLQPAMSFSKSLIGAYKVTASSLNMRFGASADKYGVIVAIPKDKNVNCFGYYTETNGIKWLLVTYGNNAGFCCSTYLKKI